MAPSGDQRLRHGSRIARHRRATGVGSTSMGPLVTRPSGPCRPRDVGRLFRDVPGPRRGMRPDRSRQDRAPHRSAAPRATRSRSTPQPSPIGAVTRGAHHGDDLLHRRRVSGIASPLIPRWATLVKSRHRDRRTTMTGSVIQNSRHVALLTDTDETVQLLHPGSSQARRNRGPGWCLGNRPTAFAEPVPGARVRRPSRPSPEA